MNSMLPFRAYMRTAMDFLFDYGMALDLYYFNQIWSVRKKLFKGNDLDEITKAYGEKFDMLNLQFIQRSNAVTVCSRQTFMPC